VTSLHYTLIVLGVCLVVAVFIYNAYQEHRSRKQAERIFGFHGGELRHQPLATEAAIADPISLTDGSLYVRHGDTRIEPRINLADDEALVADRDSSPVESGSEEPITAAEPARPAPETTGQRTDLEPESPLDSEIEYIARLRYSQPMALTFAALQDNLRRISKPIRLLGRRADGDWEPVLAHASRTYDTVELGLLLADRTGPASEVQLDTFCRRLYEFAAEHGGAVSCQDKPAALARAKALDAFCAEVDMLIGLNIISESGLDFSSHAIQEQVGAAGLIQGADGRYGLRDEAGQLLFTLALHDEQPNPAENDRQGVVGLGLLFDVPRVAHGLDAFDRMARLGFDLAQHLGGQLVDDGGRRVSRESLAKDRKYLEMIYDHMVQRGIPGGGERALRLFV